MGLNNSDGLHGDIRQVNAAQLFGRNLRQKRRLSDTDNDDSKRTNNRIEDTCQTDEHKGDDKDQFLAGIPSLTSSLTPEFIQSPGCVSNTLITVKNKEYMSQTDDENGTNDENNLELSHLEYSNSRELLNGHKKQRKLHSKSLFSDDSNLETKSIIELKIPSSTLSSTSSLVSLPDEIFELIFTFLSIQDIISLSNTNKALRKWLTPRIFRKVKCKWNQLDKIETNLSNCLLVIRQLRIEDCCRFSEWHLNLFPQLQTDLPNLTQLLINSNDSSNWLKYRQFKNLQKLTLYKDEDSIKSIEPRIFSLDHLYNFPDLSTLHLYNYHIDWNSSIKSPIRLRNLILNNCSWGYPFKLSQFNNNCCLSNLEITYANHSFILSERFLDFLHESDTQLISIKSLSIDCVKSLSPLILSTLIENFPNLKSLTLLNWKVNAQKFIPLYLSKLKTNNLKELNISLFGYSDDDIVSYTKENFPNIKFTIQLLKPPEPFACRLFL